MDLHWKAVLCGLVASLVLALATWAVSLAKRDASIVDSVWGLLILFAGAAYYLALAEHGPRAPWLLLLAALWALRLSAYITWRNWGAPEDRRYRAIRARNEPGFAWKSAYLVFGLQAALAWMVSAPLLAGIASPAPLGWLDALGAGVVVLGIFYESLADWQLARFKAKRMTAHSAVLDRGLWRYSRHPNYFGEFCVWWGFFLIALSAGGWPTIASPLLMSWLLLKVSGVALLEADLRGRKPEYREYVERTNAFFPGPRRGTP
jgi:steroid 5-alpha reductase family enzyme